jgi:DNA invertase Pin-like site-specific DNA recombinase
MPRKSRKAFLQEQQPTPVEEFKCATWGYARISNDGDKSEDSIESQTAIIQDYVTDKSDLDLRGVVKDWGFSGTNFDRPGYAELLAGIIAGEVQCVVVKDLSRLGRTYIEVGELLFDTFPAHNIRFISVNDNYDSFADDAARKKLLILFKNLVNHMYSKDMGEKIRSSFVLKQQKGELLGSMSPYGFLFTTEGGGKRLAIEPESAKIVKLIFNMRERGDSMIKIVRYKA